MVVGVDEAPRRLSIERDLAQLVEHDRPAVLGVRAAVFRPRAPTGDFPAQSVPSVFSDARAHCARGCLQ